MLNGDEASFTVTEGVVKIGDAQVTWQMFKQATA